MSEEVKKVETTEPDKETRQFRSAWDARHLWSYLFIDEAKKRGLDSQFVHDALRRYGQINFAEKYPQDPKIDDMHEFAEVFMPEMNRKCLDATVDVTDDQIDIYMNYCARMVRMRKMGASIEEIQDGCDQGFQGDKGTVIDGQGWYIQRLESPAYGDPVCHLRITRTKPEDAHDASEHKERAYEQK